MYKAKVVSVQKVAWNEEIVTLKSSDKGEDFEIKITLRNPEDHGAYAVDEEVTIKVD